MNSGLFFAHGIAAVCPCFTETAWTDVDKDCSGRFSWAIVVAAIVVAAIVVANVAVNEPLRHNTTLYEDDRSILKLTRASDSYT